MVDGAHLPAPAVFLGALPSEINEPDELSPAFAQLADVTERVVAAVRAGQMPEQLAAEHLRTLRLLDDAGNTWCVGATSLRWYRKTPGREWRPAVPPANPDETSATSATQALAALGPQVLADLGVGTDVVQPDVYTVDPFAVTAPAPAAWEFEVGDARSTRAFDAPPPLLPY